MQNTETFKLVLVARALYRYPQLDGADKAEGVTRLFFVLVDPEEKVLATIMLKVYDQDGTPQSLGIIPDPEYGKVGRSIDQVVNWLRDRYPPGQEYEPGIRMEFLNYQVINWEYISSRSDEEGDWYAVLGLTSQSHRLRSFLEEAAKSAMTCQFFVDKPANPTAARIILKDDDPNFQGFFWTMRFRICFSQKTTDNGVMHGTFYRFGAPTITLQKLTQQELKEVVAQWQSTPFRYTDTPELLMKQPWAQLLLRKHAEYNDTNIIQSELSRAVLILEALSYSLS